MLTSPHAHSESHLHELLLLTAVFYPMEIRGDGKFKIQGGGFLGSADFPPGNFLLNPLCSSDRLLGSHLASSCETRAVEPYR